MHQWWGLALESRKNSGICVLVEVTPCLSQVIEQTFPLFKILAAFFIARNFPAPFKRKRYSSGIRKKWYYRETFELIDSTNPALLKEKKKIHEKYLLVISFEESCTSILRNPWNLYAIIWVSGNALAWKHWVILLKISTESWKPFNPEIINYQLSDDCSTWYL